MPQLWQLHAQNKTKLAELKVLIPEDTKHIRTINVAALKLLQDPEDTHMYVNELMKSNEVLWFPTPENPGNEEEHTPVQRRILDEIRDLIKKEEVDPTKDAESRKKSWTCSNGKDSRLNGMIKTIGTNNDIIY